MALATGRISSGMTYLYKRIFPFFWFGFLLLFFFLQFFISGFRGADFQIPFLLIPAAMMVFGYFLMKKLVFDLVDEVTDVGDALLVRNGPRQEKIALSDIINVNYSPLINPPRVTLTLRDPGIFGKEVTFCAPVRLMPFSQSPIIQDLIARVDAARNKAVRPAR